MDFGLIGGSVASIWIAWNFWSLVPVFIVFIVGAVIWKVVITPKEYQERLAWNQAKENQKLSTPRLRRIGTTVLIWVFGLMASTIFCIAIYKMIFD